MSGSSIDFCVCCGCWIAANTGTLRQGVDGTEIICAACLALERQTACPISLDRSIDK